jgi:hypothetical protein
MRDFPSEEEVDAYGTQLMAEGEQGCAADGDNDWSLAMTVFRWDDWVLGLERGGLWFDVEWESACVVRHDLDVLIEAFGESDDFIKLVLFVDRIDQRFKRATVAVGKVVGHDDVEWWWHRVPRRTDQRLFLRDRWRPKR